MPTSDIGIDLGTRNSLDYSTGKGLVINEPSIVVYDKNTEKIRAIGEEARLMEGRITSDMEIIRPIRQGVIVDYTVTEKMLKYFISRAIGRRAFRKPRISICVPSGITEIEKKAVEEATYQAGARDVYMVEEPIAAAIGAGVDVTKPFGNLVVDIGAGTSDVAVISLAGVVVSASVKVAGDTFNQAILNYVRKNHGLYRRRYGREDQNSDWYGYRGIKSENNGSKGEKCDHRSAEDSDTYLRRNTCGVKGCYKPDCGDCSWNSGKDTAGTGCGYCRQRNRTYRRRCPSSWDGYTDRAENRSKYTDCAGCNERGRSGNR